MGTKVILMTGVPGVGKTFLCAALEERVSPLETINFAEIIREVQAERAGELAHESLRQDPTVNAPLTAVSEATSVFLERLAELRQSTNVLVDSHAVAQVAFGFRVTPDSANYLAKVVYDAIVVLRDAPQHIAERINRDRAGRSLPDETVVSLHMQLQEAVSISYAVSLGCPLFVLNRELSLEQDISNICRVFDAISMEYKEHKR